MTASATVHSFVDKNMDREELGEASTQPTVTKIFLVIQNLLLHDREHPILLMQSSEIRTGWTEDTH